MDDNFCVILSNLRNDISTGKLRQLLKELFDCMRLQALRREQINLLPGNSTAEIYLRSDKEINEVFDQLNYPNLQIQSRLESVSSSWPLAVKRAPRRRVPDKSSYSSEFGGNTRAGQSNIYHEIENHHSSQSPNVQHNQNVSSAPGPSQPTGSLDIIVAGSYIGHEDRHQEFKAGQGEYLVNYFKKDVEKYTCGFLNSEGGALYIGVNDSGEVIGVPCDHREEDKQKQAIDNIMRSFKPSLLPAMYKVDFLSVTYNNPYKLCTENRKVIRLVVFHPPPLKKLYETPSGEVYMRRDGSTEQMKPQAIQDWMLQQIESNGTHTSALQKDLALAIQQLKNDRQADSSAPSRREVELEIELKRITQSHEKLKVSHKQALIQLESHKTLPSSSPSNEEVNAKKDKQETNRPNNEYTKSQAGHGKGETHSTDGISISNGGKDSNTSTKSTLCSIL